MIVTELFETLQQAGVELWVEGDRLRFRAPAGALDADLKAALAENKGSLLQHIRDLAVRERHAHPLSYTQQAMWFLHRSAPESHAYNIGFAARIRSTVAVGALRNALQALMDRHPTLRTTYAMNGTEPVQHVHGALPLALHEVDAAGWDDARVHAEVAAAQDCPFDITSEVFRGHLFTLAAADHVLLLTVHHIAADGWSGWLLLEELRALYTAQVSGRAAGLPRPAATYTDHVRWQREMLAGTEGERLWTYWHRQLEKLPSPVELPTDHPRPPVIRYRGASVNFSIDRATTDALKTLSRQSGTTLFTTVLAAYNVLLWRYTGQLDLLVGTPVFGRGRAEVQNVVGDFINTVVLRSDVSGNPRFTDLLARTRETVLQALAHEDYPFPLLVQRLGVPRQPSRSPVFQTMFLLQKAQKATDVGRLFMPSDGGPGVDFGGMLLESYDLAQQEGQVDLTLDMAEAAGCLFGKFKYSTDLFDRSTIERMDAHFRRLIESILATPEAPIGDLEIMPDVERAELLFDWNRTDGPYAAEIGLAGMFEAQVARTPAAIAISQGQETRTYQQLNARANQIAHRLRALGVGPDVLVGVGLQRTPDLVAALLAVSKAGGAYVPLDPAFPAQRIEWMLEDARPGVLITQRDLLTNWPATTAHVLCLDDPQTALDAESTADLSVAVDPEALAYVIFTSGSTGRPKGVQIPRRAVVNFLTGMQEAPGLASTDRLLAVTTLSFDIAVLELFLPLVTGASIVLATRAESTDGQQLMQLVDSSGATVMQATPATWRMLVDLGWSGNPSLRILCGGEALAPDLAQALLDRGAEVWNLFGPTETTVWSTLGRVTRGEPITVGRPMLNTQVYVLGPSREPLPIGLAGDLWIAGDGVARGYHGKPDLTADRFVSNPFVPGGRMYRTGDLARWRCDGRLEHLGRSDDQVKVRGFRIELGEIELALCTHPGVRQAAAIAHGPSGSARLVAFIVPTGREIDSSELRRHIRQYVPDYMIPSAFFGVDAFPQTANGKLDRRVLQASAESLRSAEAPTSEGPRTPIEDMLASIWGDVLQVKSPGIHDDFFELGGHSLLAARLMQQLSEIFWVELPLRLLFDAPTIAQMAAAIVERLDARHAETASTDVLEIQTNGSRPPFFFLHAATQGDGFYCFNLARHLGEDQPMYALSPMPSEGSTLPATVEDLAAMHRATIQRIQPHGPYYLGGFCASGVIAFEIARQLTEAGERVEVVIPVESYIHEPDRLSRNLDRFVRAMASAFGLSSDRRLGLFLALRPIARRLASRQTVSARTAGGFLLRRARRAASRLSALLRRASNGVRKISSDGSAPAAKAVPGSQAIMHAYIRAIDGYVAPFFDGRIVCLVAENSPHPASAWRNVASDIQIEAVAGDHNTCITTQIGSLGEHLRTALGSSAPRLSSTAEIPADCSTLSEALQAGAVAEHALAKTSAALMASGSWMLSVLAIVDWVPMGL